MEISDLHNKGTARVDGAAKIKKRNHNNHKITVEPLPYAKDNLTRLPTAPESPQTIN